MTNQNIQESSHEEIIEKEKKIAHTNIQGLLKEGIVREFGNPINPEKYDAYKKSYDSMNNTIRVHMKDIRRENSGDWNHITDTMIDVDIKNSEINEHIARMGKDLALMRKRVFNRVIEVFPNIKNLNNWSETLNDELSHHNQNELRNYATRTISLRKLVYATFPDLKGVNPSETRDFEKIFHDRDQYLDEFGKQKFVRVYKDFVQFGQVPDSEDVDFLLSAYKDASKNRKKEILAALGATLTIKSAYDSGLINNEFLQQLAEKSMEGIYSQLTEDQKSSFIRGLAQDESYVIPASDFEVSVLDNIFSDPRKRKKLARDVFHSLALDVPESLNTEGNILAKIRKRKQKEAEVRGIEEDYDLYDAFVEEMEQRLQGKVKNLKHLRTPGCVIRFNDATNGVQQVRVKKVHNLDGSPLEVENGMNYGIELEGLAAVDGVIRETQNFSLSYDQFQQFLEQSQDTNVLRSEDFEDLLVSKVEDAGKDGKIFDARVIDQDPANANNIAVKLDLIDSEGREFGFEEGTSFIAPSKEKGTGKKYSEDIWTVKKISGDTVDLMDSVGMSLEKGVPLSEFFSFVASTGTFKRIARIKDDAEMVKELHEFGLDHNVKLRDGKLTVEEHDEDHEQSHAKEKEVTCFESKEGGHIRMEYIQNGQVRFGEYSSNTEEKKVREIIEKNGIKSKDLKDLYTWKTMSYSAFLQYLEKNKLSATMNDPIVPNTAHNLHGGHDGGHAHMDQSFLKRMMKWQNPASIWKGFEMIVHSIEHTLEKGAKLDASRFAMRTSRFLGLPDSVTAQVYSDVVNESKEIIEKYEQKIFGLPGPAGRWKCIHIVHNKDSRAEEVISAINYMLKSYGHLYAEDIKHYQSVVNPRNIAKADPGYFAFLDGFILTSNLPGGLSIWRKKAYEKAITEMGTMDDHEGEPTEEQLIHALLKSIDGNWNEFPYAASVVKASGGPSGFEKNWKFEGFDNAYKKGKDQTQMVNAQGRLNKAVGYFTTHEIYKAVGAMEKVVGKTKDPKMQAMPFIWAVGGYSQHASHTALQKLKDYAEQGFSFHAFAFLRNKQGNDIYRETVRLALKDLIKQGKITNGSALDDFNKICERLENGPESTEVTDKKYNKTSPAKAMMEFWQTYQGTGLHDMLQGHNGWLVKEANSGNATVKKYMSIFETSHLMQLNDGKIPQNDLGKDWYDEHGLHMNRIWDYDQKTGLRSLNRTLNMINVGRRTGDFNMEQAVHDKLWAGIIEQIKSTQDSSYFGGDKDLQKRQYLAYRKEILEHFIKQYGTSIGEKIDMSKLSAPYQYWDELRKMGIDPKAVFDIRLVHDNEEQDYNTWISGSSVMQSHSPKDIPNIKNMISGRVQKVGDKKPSLNDSRAREAA